MSTDIDNRGTPLPGLIVFDECCGCGAGLFSVDDFTVFTIVNREVGASGTSIDSTMGAARWSCALKWHRDGMELKESRELTWKKSLLESAFSSANDWIASCLGGSTEQRKWNPRRAFLPACVPLRRLLSLRERLDWHLHSTCDHRGSRLVSVWWTSYRTDWHHHRPWAGVCTVVRSVSDRHPSSSNVERIHDSIGRDLRRRGILSRLSPYLDLVGVLQSTAQSMADLSSK